MFHLVTDRLQLYPLDLTHLLLLQRNRNVLEEHLGWKISNMKMEAIISKEITEAMDYWVACLQEDALNYRWHTSWEIFLPVEQRSIGVVGLNGLPNELGEMVIGYSIDVNYHNKGYMTEALKELVAWAEINPRLKRMLAETPRNNLPSQKVLKKTGFEQVGIFEERDTLLWGKWNYRI